MPRTKPPSNKVLTIRLTEADFHLLEGYCADRGKTKTEVLVDLIRRLKQSNVASSAMSSHQ
ncbi:MAG: hypothetical protein ACLFV6_01735 [Spirulinaceae cyanobacterium]